MSDRFYTQQLEATGWCPGYRGTKTIAEYQTKFGKIRRKRKMAWTDESKAQAVEMYTAEEPTPETSMEIVKTIAEELNESPNGVRMILTKAVSVVALKYRCNNCVLEVDGTEKTICLHY